MKTEETTNFESSLKIIGLYTFSTTETENLSNQCQPTCSSHLFRVKELSYRDKIEAVERLLRMIKNVTGQSYEPKLAIEQMESKYAAKTDLRKNIIAKKTPTAKKIDKKQDELLFAEKLLQRKLASEPGVEEGTNFKPRTDYDNGPGMMRTISTPHGTGTEIKKRSNTRRLSLPDVDPQKQDRDHLTRPSTFE